MGCKLRLPAGKVNYSSISRGRARRYSHEELFTRPPGLRAYSLATSSAQSHVAAKV